MGKMLALKLEMKLFRRKNGYWYVRFERGKERSLRTKDRRLAERLFKEIQKEALRGRLVFLEKEQKIDLKTFSKEYLQWAVYYKSPETVRRDKLALNNLLQIVGNKPLRGISVRDVEKFFAVCLERGRKQSGINVDYRHLKAAFNKALEWGYIKSNPFSRIKPLKVPKEPPRYLSPEEVLRVLEALKDDPDFHDIVLFTLETGCRRQEILRLTTEDLDFEHGFVYIRGKGNKVRAVPMTSRIRELLKRRCDGRKGKVFPAWHKDTITKKWKKLMKRLGMDYRFHHLRHTTASWLAIQGVPLQFIQELLGHSSVTVTQIYAHLNPNVLRESLERTFAGLEHGNAGKVQAMALKRLEKQRRTWDS